MKSSPEQVQNLWRQTISGYVETQPKSSTRGYFVQIQLMIRAGLGFKFGALVTQTRFLLNHLRRGRCSGSYHIFT